MIWILNPTPILIVTKTVYRRQGLAVANKSQDWVARNAKGGWWGLFSRLARNSETRFPQFFHLHPEGDKGAGAYYLANDIHRLAHGS